MNICDGVKILGAPIDKTVAGVNYEATAGEVADLINIYRTLQIGNNFRKP